MHFMVSPDGLGAPHHMALDAYYSNLDLEEPVLRIYEFSMPTVTIGFRQNLEECLIPGAQHKYRLDFSRRVTGGKALLHQDGITYSLIIPRRLLNSDVKSSYRTICAPLFAALSKWNENLRFECLNLPTSGLNQACFLEHAEETFHVNGIKVAGSAQRRSRKNILQHGQIQLFPPKLNPGEILLVDNKIDRSALDLLSGASILTERSENLLEEVVHDIRSEFEKNFGNSKSYALKCRDYTDQTEFLEALEMARNLGFGSYCGSEKSEFRSEEREGSVEYAT